MSGVENQEPTPAGVLDEEIKGAGFLSWKKVAQSIVAHLRGMDDVVGRIATRVASIEDAALEPDEDVEEIQGRLDEMEKRMDALAARLPDPNKPYIDVRFGQEPPSAEYPEGRITMVADWNAAMIERLDKMGFSEIEGGPEKKIDAYLSVVFAEVNGSAEIIP